MVCQIHGETTVLGANDSHYPLSCIQQQLTSRLIKHQPFIGLFSRITWVSRYQKGKTNLDFTEARDSEWQWHQLGHMQVCTSLQTDNHASTPPLSFLQARCPSCRPTNSVKALKAIEALKFKSFGPREKCIQLFSESKK